MTIPHDDIIQLKLLELLDRTPDGTMHCNDVYSALATQFPELTEEEISAPYQSSLSKWANRVQWARQHLVEKGWLLRPYSGEGPGYWTISAKGRKALHDPIDLGF